MYCNVDQLGEEDHLHCKALTSILARFTVRDNIKSYTT